MRILTTEKTILKNDLCQVILSLDQTYRIGKQDSDSYDLVLNPDELIASDDWYETISIQVFLPNKHYHIAMPCETYGSVELDRFAVLQDAVLSIIHGFTITRIDLTTEQIISEWKLDTYMPNYAFYKVSNGYVLHGESNITMFSDSWEEKWSFESRDIFFTPDDTAPIEILNDRIVVRDFIGGYYELDFQGNVLVAIE